MFSFAPYRRPATEPASGAEASVHECGDVVVELHAPLGPATILLDPRTVDVRYASRLHELSVPLFLTAFLFGACEGGALALMSRTIRGLPDGALRVLLLPALVFVIAAFGHFDPAARRVRVQGATRSGHHVATAITFATARGAKRFVEEVQDAARRATVAELGQTP
jgi:hypothetical protein